ncbi:SDR family NAD(P)-dependent oxidoreductase [Mumia sp. Pv 4-285]|uniref:SDR family NAD(P)-dependent oxidoreductase n=1 Tax=Mumia qirimensis TaxID=3234852 RepID=UPI00351D8428
MTTARVAVVTGGGRGLGRATALRLAREGIDVAVVARSLDEVSAVADEAKSCGVRARGLSVDVTSTEAVDAARDEIERDLGRVVILVNNAGNLLYKPFVPLPGQEGAYPGFDSPIGDDEWASVMEVHLGGAMRMLRAFGPGMLERRTGRVVNVVSNVVRRSVPFTVGYDTAKGALVQLTRSLAREWGRYGVTVNAVAAGHFKTEMTREQFENVRAHEKMIQRVAVRRTGELEEFADLVAYLCSETAGFVTGEVIAIDGGETL